LVSLATSRQNLSEAEVKQAASGDLLTFMISELNRAALSLQAIADGLNDRSIPTARGGSWSATQVMRVLART
jgi:hypothetical protein